MCALSLLLARQAAEGGRIVTGDNWEEWGMCSDDPGAFMARSLAGVPATKEGAAANEEIHSIIQIEDDGVLKFSENGDFDLHVLSALRREESPIHVIAIFGKLKAGKSTLLTALSCAFAHLDGGHQDTVPVHFKPSKGHKTKGLWASPPFEYRGKKLVLLDLEGLGDASSGAVGVDMEDPRKREHGLVKIVAMLSEVVSVFVYVSGQEEATTGDYDEISKAMKVTRRNLIYRDEEETAAFQHSSTDHPALFISRRVRSAGRVKDSYLQKRRFDVEESSLSSEAVKDFEEHIGPQSDFRQIMLDNFRNISEVAELQGGNFAPFRNAPVILMPVGDQQEYNWAEDLWLAADDGFGRTEHCQHYLDMYRPEHRCREEQSRAPPRPALYKMLVDHMAHDLWSIARPRTLRDREGPGRPVTGRTFVEYLQIAVQEMNKIRPLPETVLWRAVLEESCSESLVRLVEATFGKSTEGCEPSDVDAGRCGGALARIERRMELRRSEVEANKRRTWRALVGILQADIGLPAWVNKVWDESDTEWRTKLEETFQTTGGHANYASVREKCEAPAKQLIEQYMHIKEGFFFEAQKLKMELDLAMERKRADWEQNKWMWLAYGTAGLLALILISNLLGKMHGAVQCLATCCGLCCGRAGRQREPKGDPEGAVNMELSTTPGLRRERA